MLIQRVPWEIQPPPGVKARLGGSGPIAVVLPQGGSLVTQALGLYEPLAFASGTGVRVQPGPLGFGAGSASASSNSFRLHSVANQTNTVWERPSAQVSMVVVAIARSNTGGVNRPIFGNVTTASSPFWGWGIVHSQFDWLTFESAAGGSLDSLAAPATLPLNSPLVISATYDGATKRLYQNGVEVASVADSGSLTYPSDATRGPVLGNFYNFGGDTRSFLGDIYLALLFDRGLTQAEAGALRTPADAFSLAFEPRRIFVPAAVAGAVTHPSTGALAADAATAAGSATHLTLHTSTGALAAQAATVAGSAVSPHLSTGALAGQDATVAGTATHLTLHTSSGALAAADASVSGSADASKSASGALSAQAATVAGSATHLTLHTSSGAIAAGAATVAGSAVHPHLSTGALVADAATVSGSADKAGDFDATGSLSADAAAVVGAATRFALHTSTAALAAQAAAVAGSAARLALHTSSGAIAAGAATVAGSAAHIVLHDATGDLEAGAATMSGSALLTPFGSTTIPTMPPYITVYMWKRTA